MTAFKAIRNFLAGLALVTVLISGCVPVRANPPVDAIEPSVPAPEDTPGSTVPPPTAEPTLPPVEEPTPEPTEALEDQPVTVTPIPDVCDISYPTMCIPVGASDVLNCADITQRRFPVEGHDSQNFDANGNGIGCESR